MVHLVHPRSIDNLQSKKHKKKKAKGYTGNMYGQSGKGLKQFMERRSSSSVPLPPPIPRGRPEYAPLELLSELALQKLRKQGTQAFLPTSRLIDSANQKPQLTISGRESPLSPVTLSPPSKLNFNCRFSFAESDSMHEDISVPQMRTHDSSLSEAQQDRRHFSRESVHPRLDVGHVIRRKEREIKEGGHRSRGQPSRFCHICSYCNFLCSILLFETSKYVCPISFHVAI